MPPQAAKKTPISIDDYLAGERDAETCHDYLDGAVYAMSGASDRHALIVNALAFALTPHARQRRCQLFTNDMKLRLEVAGATVFYYPDLMIACDPEDRAPDFRTRPCLDAEVLSPGTERIDRRAHGWKAERCDQGSLHLNCLDAELAVEQVYADVDWAQG
jgi:Uma2 family endonuclease